MQDRLLSDINRIVAMTNRQGMMGITSHPAQGQFVVTGLQPWARSSLSLLGFCVQVRKGCGQFGSDMVFLRHADGSLITHENQCYYPMTDLQERLARRIFNSLPNEEDYAVGYRCVRKVHEVGFLIEGSASTPAALRSGVAMSVQTKDDKAHSETRHVAFL